MLRAMAVGRATSGATPARAMIARYADAPACPTEAYSSAATRKNAARSTGSISDAHRNQRTVGLARSSVESGEPFCSPWRPAVTKIWSETPVARVKEQVADLATFAWVVFWGNLAWQLFQLLAGFAQAGRTIHSGGQAMIQGGRDLGESLSGVPLIG